MVNPIVKKKPTPSQKAYSTPKSSPPGKEILKKPSLVSKASSDLVSMKAGVAKRKRLIDDEAEEEEEDWEEVDEPEQGDFSEEDEEEDAYAQLESEDELAVTQKSRPKKKTLVATSKPPPKKKKSGDRPSGWFEFAKKAVERVPLFSELQL